MYRVCKLCQMQCVFSDEKCVQTVLLSYFIPTSHILPLGVFVPKMSQMDFKTSQEVRILLLFSSNFSQFPSGLMKWNQTASGWAQILKHFQPVCPLLASSCHLEWICMCLCHSMNFVWTHSTSKGVMTPVVLFVCSGTRGKTTHGCILVLVQFLYIPTFR